MLSFFLSNVSQIHWYYHSSGHTINSALGELRGVWSSQGWGINVFDYTSNSPMIGVVLLLYFIVKLST